MTSASVPSWLARVADARYCRILRSLAVVQLVVMLFGLAALHDLPTVICRNLPLRHCFSAVGRPRSLHLILLPRCSLF